MHQKSFSIKLAALMFFSLTCMAGIPQESLGALKDFKDDVEREEKSNRRNGSDSSGGSGGFGESCFGSCMEAALEITFSLWAVHNMLVWYEDYPFAGSNKKFINYYKLNQRKRKEGDPGPHMVAYHEQSLTAEEKPEDSLSPFSNKFYYYTIAAGGQWARDEGSGFFVELRGKFMQHFGPEFTARSLWDGDDNFQYYTGGLNLSLFQTNIIAMDFYLTGAFFRGLLDRSGVGYGTIITSYPIKPVTLFIKVGGISFDKIDFLEFEGRIGFMINRVEIFAGYHLIHHENTTDIGGPLGGVRVFL